jgi:hypothetical protein
MDPRMQPQMDPRMMQPQMNNVQRNAIVNNSVPDNIKTGRFGKSFNFSNKNTKNAILVVLIFILLNSRMIWRAISRLPMMGSIEPSILALVVNSIIAGIVFYILSTNFNKS